MSSRCITECLCVCTAATVNAAVCVVCFAFDSGHVFQLQVIVVNVMLLVCRVSWAKYVTVVAELTWDPLHSLRAPTITFTSWQPYHMINTIHTVNTWHIIIDDASTHTLPFFGCEAQLLYLLLRHMCAVSISVGCSVFLVVP